MRPEMPVTGQSGNLKTILVMLLWFLSDSVANPIQTDLVQRMTVTAGEEALFPVNITSGKRVKSTKFDFFPKLGEPYQLAVLQNGKLEPSNPKDVHRLEMVSEATLRIKALQENETGILKVRVTYTTSETEEFSFQVMVSAPDQKTNSSQVLESKPSQTERDRKWIIAVFIVLPFLIWWIVCNCKRGTPQLKVLKNVEDGTEESSALLAEGTTRQAQRQQGWMELRSDLDGASKQSEVGGCEDHRFPRRRCHSETSQCLSAQRPEGVYKVCPRKFRRRMFSA